MSPRAVTLHLCARSGLMFRIYVPCSFVLVFSFALNLHATDPTQYQSIIPNTTLTAEAVPGYEAT